MTRALVLAYMRIAGYHDDRATFTRLYIENRIGRARANEAFRAGQAAKLRGVPCTCTTCNPTRN